MPRAFLVRKTRQHQAAPKPKGDGGAERADPDQNTSSAGTGQSDDETNSRMKPKSAELLQPSEEQLEEEDGRSDTSSDIDVDYCSPPSSPTSESEPIPMGEYNVLLSGPTVRSCSGQTEKVTEIQKKIVLQAAKTKEREMPVDQTSSANRTLDIWAFFLYAKKRRKNQSLHAKNFPQHGSTDNTGSIGKIPLSVHNWKIARR